MPTPGTYTTPEGILVRLGKYYVDNQGRTSSGKLNTLGSFEKFELEVDLTRLTAGSVDYDADRDNDGTNDGYLASRGIIPANSTIKSVTVFTREAAAGGTSLNIGLFQLDGTVVTADDDLATVAVADVDTVGKRVDGAGTKTVAATSATGAEDSTVGITSAGTFTAGKVQIVVEYALN